MPSLRAWMEEKRQMDFTHPTPSQVNRMLIDLMMCECVDVIPSHHVMSLTLSSVFVSFSSSPSMYLYLEINGGPS